MKSRFTTAENITIPKEVDHGGETYAVTSIGAEAFSGVGIRSIVIPQSVISIGDRAFEKTCLRSIVIPQSVETIGHGAFYYCRVLADVTINNETTAPSQLTTIGVDAFRYSWITAIVIPQSVTSIGEKAFFECTELADVTITNMEGAPSRLTEIADYTFAGTAYNSGGITSIVIPQSVTSIGNYAFSYCLSFTSITINNETTAPSQLTIIGEEAFRRSMIESIVIPQSVKILGDNLFEGCTTLTDVTIINTADTPSQLSHIDDRAFYGTGITSIVIPQSVTRIGYSVFAYTKSLTDVTIKNDASDPSKLTLIDDSAFNESAITSIIIPQSVERISQRAFTDCKSLTDVTIKNDASDPSKLTLIDDGAFIFSGITSIVIPQSVTSIGHDAFAESSELSVLVFSSTTSPTFGAKLFRESVKDIKVFVPFASKASYKTALETETVLEGYEKTLSVLGYGELVMPVSALADAPILESGYSQSIVATGGIEGEVVEYKITDGTLPEGLSMDNKGNITGTATKVGTSTFTITATVANAVAKLAYSSEKEYAIKVTDTIAPVISVEEETVDIEINGAIDEAKFLELAKVTADDNSNGVITITTDFDTVKQNAVGTATVTITATDESGNVSTKTVTINVTDTTPTTEEPTTKEPTAVTEETTTEATTEGSGSGSVETGDNFVTPLFFIIALFSVVVIIITRKRKEEQQG